MANFVKTAAIMRGLDSLVEQRYDAAVEHVAELRTEHPFETADQLADRVVSATTKELALVGAMSGGVAAVPFWGTAISLGAMTADTAWTMSRLAEMVMTLGVVYGYDGESIESRRAWVMTVLAAANGAVNGVDGAAASVGTKAGEKAVASLADARDKGLKSKIATRVVTRLTTEQMASRIGRLIPFGLGAGVGAVGNALIARSVAKAARQFFHDQRAVIDVDEVTVERSPLEVTGGDVRGGGEPTPTMRP